MRIHLSLALAAAALCIGAASSLAATATGSFNSQLVITAECKVQSASMLNFGTDGVLDAAINTTSTIGVQCTTGQTYTISLNGGNGASGTTAVRTMESGGSSVNYTMATDVNQTSNWGDSGGEIVTGTPGTGAVQNYTVYGRVPPQTTPAPATYTDLVTITVTYP